MELPDDLKQAVMRLGALVARSSSPVLTNSFYIAEAGRKPHDMGFVVVFVGKAGAEMLKKVQAAAPQTLAAPVALPLDFQKKLWDAVSRWAVDGPSVPSQAKMQAVVEVNDLVGSLMLVDPFRAAEAVERAIAELASLGDRFTQPAISVAQTYLHGALRALRKDRDEVENARAVADRVLASGSRVICDAARPCCDRRGEYNGFGSDGPRLFECPRSCPCHD